MYGPAKEAQTVHHIYPLELYPELALVNWNLLPVTFKAHNTFHNRIDNTITVKGKYWQKKRRKEFEVWQKQRTPPI